MRQLFYNGCISTLDDTDHFAEAVGIEDGTIVFVGTDEDAFALTWDKRQNLHGQLLLPGFVDTHLHMLHYAFVENSVKLFNCKSVEDALMLAKKRLDARDVSPLTALFCRGWNEDLFDIPRYPTREELDTLANDIPVIMVRVCGHKAVCNSYGLEKLRLLPNFSEIEKDIDFATGVLRENAVQFFYSILDTPTQKEIESLIQFGVQRLNEKGITGIQSDDLASLPGKNWHRILQAFQSLDRKGALSLRVYEQCLFERFDDLKSFVAEGYRTGQRGKNFTIGPIKLLQDGSLGARTAALTQPYIDSENNIGQIIYTQDELDAIVAFCDEHKLQLAVHCIGDRAMEMVIQAIQHSKHRLNNPKNRHGIVHLQITTPEILEAMRDNAILAYIQPVFVDLDMDIVKSCIGVERMQSTYAWKTLLDLGIHTSGGSDAPVVSFDVMENIYFAVTRKNIQGKPENGWLPDQKLSVSEAVKLFTKYAAYASYTETVNGTIEIGKRADFVILDENIYTVDPEHIKNIRINQTILNGKTVYKRI